MVRAGERACAAGELEDAWTSQPGIAKHQNTMQFLSTLYLYVRESGPDFQDLVLPSIIAAIKPIFDPPIPPYDSRLPYYSLAILAILARDIPAPIPLRCDLMDWGPLR